MFSRIVVSPMLLALLILSVRTVSAEPGAEIARAAHRDGYGDPLPRSAVLRIGTSRLHHGDFVNHVGFTPDGKMLVSCSWDGTLRSWEAATGKEIHCFKGHQRAVMSFSISKDGKTLASISQDYTIRIWDLRTGKELRKLDALRGSFYDVAFSPDGQTLVCCGPHMRIWETKNYQVVREFEAENKWVHCLAFSPDGKNLVSGGGDGVISFWDTTNWKEIHRFPAHKGKVQSLAFSPNGKFLASAGYDGSLCLRNPETGEEIRSLSKRGGPRGCSRLAFSPDGKMVAWAWGAEGIIRSFDTSTGREVIQLNYKKYPLGIAALAFSPDGQILASGSRSTIRLWDVKTAKKIAPLPNPPVLVSNLVFCSNDKMLAGVSWGDTIYCWDPISGKELRQLKGHSKESGLLRASPDGQALVSFSAEDGVVSLWDVNQGKELLFFQVNKHCSPTAVSPDGKLLAAGESERKGGKIYDIHSGKELGRFGAAWKVIFLPDGKSLMLHVPNRGFARWDIAAGKIVSWLPGFDPRDRGMAVSADGRSFVSAQTMEHLVHRWDLSTGEQLSSLDSSPQKSIGGMAFSPDGRTLASGGQDGTIWLWEMRTGRRRLVLQGHKGSVMSLTYSRDGRRLASGSRDTTILVWDLTAGMSRDRPKDLTTEQLDGLWRDLADEDAAKAYRSIWQLASAGKQALPFLQARLRPIPAPDAKRISQLLADLDSDQFNVRTKAHNELEKLGEAAAASLRQAAEKPPSAEVGRRVNELRDKLKTERRTPSSERIRVLRAVEVLEHIGTPEASQILKILANGAAEAELTREAKASLDRLARRANRSK